MSISEDSQGDRARRRLPQGKASQVIIVSSVMFTFISFWCTAAIVLSDLGSTAYYIGGIVEQAIGPAAPWFILAVMLFSYAVRSVYIESVSLFVRGGVYRVTREALGNLAAKIAVSALLFDYMLTGPISSVAAGQYIMGLVTELSGSHVAPWIRTTGAMLIALCVTVYFYRQNVLGIHESSGKALQIMGVTTVMVVVVLGWCLVTLLVRGPQNAVPWLPDLTPKVNFTLGHETSPLGFVESTRLGNSLAALRGHDFFSLLGIVGLFVAFGHSILAMSGEETLAQVYREVESPKLQNFKRAAFIVFLYSLIFTAGISFLAVVLIPDDVRMSRYADNLIGGLAMSVVGPNWMRLLLNAFVVFVGFLILSGAVNTAIIGSNGVLNRVAEDGVVPNWLQKPHPRYGTTYRTLALILALQVTTILASRGNVIVLGEAYAFGVVWSFVFMTASMLVLRFRRPHAREFSVPLNIRWGRIEIPSRIDARVPCPVLLCDCQPADQDDGDKMGHWLHPGLPRRLRDYRMGQYPASPRGGASAPGTIQSRVDRAGFAWNVGIESAVPQTRGDSLAAEHVHAGKGSGRNRPGHHRRGRDDGESGLRIGSRSGRRAVLVAL